MRSALRAQPRFRTARLSLSPRRPLTTLPFPIPEYISPWNPASQSRLDPSEAGSVPNYASIDFAAHKKIRESRREAHGKSTDIAVGRKYAQQRCNDCIRLANTDISDADLKARAWKAYSLIKEFAPELLQKFSDRIWAVLWYSVTNAAAQQSTVKLAHRVELYNDMLRANQQPTPKQRAEYIGALYDGGKRKEALRKWYAQLIRYQQADQKVDPYYLECGLRLQADAGYLDRAIGTMHMLYKQHPAWELSPMMVVFSALTSSERVSHHCEAWNIYVKMRDQHKHRSRLNTFFIGFIHAEHIQFATEVFSDMVRNGLIAKDYSERQIVLALSKFNLLCRIASTLEKAATICGEALDVLPSAYHAHVFAEWLKLAVIQSDPAAAVEVFEKMYQRALQPETIHFNMLLRALLRTDSKQHVLKAENIAWTMIDALVRSGVKPALLPSAVQAIARNEAESAAMDDEQARRRTAPADADTVALLMQKHAEGAQWEHVDYLKRQMRKLDMAPNTAIMNVLMENESWRGNYNKVWEIYTAYTNVPPGEVGVFPNGATFRCLWRTLRLSLADEQNRESSTLPSPRQLLAEMVQWWSLVKSRHDAERFRVGLAGKADANYQALNNLVMHCFSYTQDLAGSLVALHVLCQYMNIVPGKDASTILRQHMAWVDMRDDTKEMRARYMRENIHEQKLAQLESMYTYMRNERLNKLDSTAERAFETWSPVESAEFDLNVLSEFVRAVWKRHQEPAIIEELIEGAKAEVGMPGLKIGDLDAFAVA